MIKAIGLTLGRAEWRDKGVLLVIAIVVGLILGLLVAALSPLHVVGGLIGLAIAIALLVNGQIGLFTFLGVVTLLPYAVVPVPLGGVKLTFLDVILSALLVVWLIRVFTLTQEFDATRIGGPVAVFILLSLVSFTIGTSYYVSPESTRLFLKLINSILFFFTVVNSVRSLHQARQLIAGFIMGGASAAAIGIALYILPAATATRLLLLLRPLGYYQTGDEVLRYIADTTTLRAIGTAVDPNVFGALLMLCLVLSISQLLSPEPVLPRVWLSLLSAITAAGLVLTFSRSSWMGLIVAILFIATIKYQRLWLVFALIGVVLYFGIIPTDVPFLSHLQSGLLAKDKAAAMRLGEYKDALELISRYPWFGVGFGSPPSVDLYVGVSSIYLLMAEQMGLIGVAAFLSVIGFLSHEVLRKLRKIADTGVQSLVLGLAAALLAALVAGVFDHHFFNIRFPHMAALFWFIVGLVAVCLRAAFPNGQSAGATEQC